MILIVIVNCVGGIGMWKMVVMCVRVSVRVSVIVLMIVMFVGVVVMV